MGKETKKRFSWRESPCGLGSCLKGWPRKRQFRPSLVSVFPNIFLSHLPAFFLDTALVANEIRGMPSNPSQTMALIGETCFGCPGLLKCAASIAHKPLILPPLYMQTSFSPNSKFCKCQKQMHGYLLKSSHLVHAKMMFNPLMI